jgi:hypothetical protein
MKMALDNSQTNVVVGNQLTRSFKVTSGVREGDAQSATIFNLALRTQINGTIVHTPEQIYGYADDIVLIGSHSLALKELYNVLEREVTWFKHNCR